VIKKPIKFPIKGLRVEKDGYDLAGITSIEGEHLNIRHKTYILKGE
jgi:hypothetical protein